MYRLKRRIHYGKILLFLGTGLLFFFGGRIKTVKAETATVVESGQQKSEEPTEIVTDKWTVISGKRLKIMLEYTGEYINFEKAGISLEIPRDVVRSWKVEDYETVQVLIRKNSGYSWEIKIYKGNREIKNIPGSQIVFSVKEVFPFENAATIRITDEKGVAPKLFLDIRQGILKIWTDKTGIFSVGSRHIFMKQKPFLQMVVIITVGVLAGIYNRKWGGSYKEEK